MILAMEQVIPGGGSTPDAAAVRYAPLAGGSTFFEDEWETEQVISSQGKLTYLRVLLDQAPGVGKSLMFTLILNGAETDLTCTIADADKSASDTINEVSVFSSDTISLKCTPTGGPTVSPTYFSIIFTAKNSVDSLLLNGGGVTTAGSTKYGGLISGSTTSFESVASGAVDQIIPAPGSIKNLRIQLSTAPGVGESAVFTVRKNGIGTAMTVTISDTSTKGSDLLHSISVVPEDMVEVSCISSGGCALSSIAMGMTFSAVTPGYFLFMMSTSDAMTINSVEYSLVNGDPWMGWVLAPSSGSISQTVDDCTVEDMYVCTSDSPGIGKNFLFEFYTATLGATALAVRISDAETVDSDLVDAIAISALDIICYQKTPAGNPAVGIRSCISMVGHRELVTIPSGIVGNVAVDQQIYRHVERMR